MPRNPEDEARRSIDDQLKAAGWIIQDMDELNPDAGRGVAVREFPLGSYGFADYLLYGDGEALGVIEAKKEGDPLTGVEVQTEKYSVGLPKHVPAWVRPLPFLYQSTGVETRFTNGLDPLPRSRDVFTFHRPETLIGWAMGLSGVATPGQAAEHGPAYGLPSSLLQRIRCMPGLDEKGMRPVPARAVSNIEESLKQNKPRALVQMATGSGKTYMAVALCDRLIRYAEAKRILFLVDRGNLGEQTEKEFQAYDLPDDGRKFTTVFNVQRLQSSTISSESRVVISTIQRLYSMLRGEELPPEADELSAEEAAPSL